MANGSNGSQTIATIQLPSPSAPSANQNRLLQDVPVYKAIRTILDVNSQPTSFGSVATTAPDGTPATFNKGGMDSVLIRIAGTGEAATIGIPNEWVAGGGETQVAHTLGRVPVGYWVVRNRLGALVSDGDSAWDSTYIYFHTTHSNSDCILMIF